MKFSLKVFLHFRAEVFLLLLFMGVCVRNVTFTQLIQDKICRFEHGKNETFCRLLSDIGDHDYGHDIKSAVLVASSQFTMFYTALTSLPSIIAMIFLGSWCDNYEPGRKILLYLSCFVITLETGIQAYMAYDFKLDYWYSMTAGIPQALGGGLSTLFIAVLSYIPATTPPDLSTIRFMFAEICISLANPLATFLGGFLLNYNTDHPIGGNGQLLNYQMVFITSAVLSIIALFWAIFMVNEKKDKLNLEKFSNDPAITIRQHIQENQQNKSQIRTLKSENEVKHKGNPIKLLFNCENVIEVFKTGTKPRPNRGRLQLWLLVSSFTFLLLGYMAPIFLMFPFAEKVYLWDSQKFSTINSTAVFLNSLGILIGTLILTKKYKMDDIPLAIIGCTTTMLSLLAKASFPNLWGFWFSTIVGMLGGLAPIGIRSYLSKIVDKDEIGKVFSLLTSVDATIPIIGNLFFTMIFTHTLDTFPGAAFDASAGLLLIPLICVIFIDSFCRKISDKIDHNMNENKPKDNENNRTEEHLTYRTRGGTASRQPSSHV